MTDESFPRPALRVIRGDATPEEIAALLAVVAARSLAPAEPDRPRRLGGWNDRANALRVPLGPGPGAWRSASWPH